MIPIKAAPKTGEHILLFDWYNNAWIEGYYEDGDWCTCFPIKGTIKPIKWFPLPTGDK